MRYLLNCGLLMLPVFAWNLALAKRLPHVFQPEIFWRDISPALGATEKGLRLAVSVLPFVMPLVEPLARRGLAVYAVGLTAYFASWLLLIRWPDSSWSWSVGGFTAPA